MQAVSIANEWGAFSIIPEKRKTVSKYSSFISPRYSRFMTFLELSKNRKIQFAVLDKKSPPPKQGALDKS